MKTPRAFAQNLRVVTRATSWGLKEPVVLRLSYTKSHHQPAINNTTRTNVETQSNRQEVDGWGWLVRVRKDAFASTSKVLVPTGPSGSRFPFLSINKCLLTWMKEILFH